MANYYGTDVDIAEFFEDGTLEAGLSEVDTGGFLTIADTEQYHEGTHAMEVNFNTLNAVSYIEAAIANDTFRATFWYRTLDNLGEWDFGPKVLDVYCPGYGDPMFIDDYYTDRHVLKLTVYGSNQSFDVAGGTWYCIQLRFTRNGTSYLRVLDTDHNEVGAVSAAMVNYQPTVMRIGETTGTSARTGNKNYFDALGIDIGDASAYLDGWAAAGGGSTTPAKMMHYARLRRN